MLLHGILVGKLGLSYITSPRNDYLLALLKEKGSEGPGLEIATPFLGAAYLTVGVLNSLAATMFTFTDATYVLISSGLFYHFGMAIVRLTLDSRIADLYKPGMIRQTNVTQFAMGMLCCGIGFWGILYT